ncbi:G-type lectin S-receptor-like serine/threonine-protein kinase LECRK1 [Lycium ferocissimum]|uniref:G-type lectin S-receptor-like serine/threonine-protein kinase LECRK1 n=1 Tax=Lycium ferocissimum TaxID=112874 RepID=UPI00281607C6|nr:G-type lectin S-receptor-like serine/threonine-protein kinase LECRK1 [Lycium ferocissimum]
MANLTFTFMFLMLPFIFAAIEVGAQQQPSNITLGSILYPNRNPSSWLSSSGLFSFGFFRKRDGFQVAIWISATSEKTVVWTANRDDPPVHSDAYLEFTKQGKLILWTKQNKKVIAESPQPVTSASMLDSGNFVIYNKTKVVWESFDYPTDTILAGQRLTSGHRLVSSVSKVDHSSGRFYLSMQADGNLVAYPTNYLNRPEASYWAFMLQSTGEFGDVDSVFIGLTPRGQLFRNASNGFRFEVKTIANSSNQSTNKAVIYRATLDPDGSFRLYTHNLDNSSLEINWSALQNQCQARGFCGVNSYCTARNDSSIGDCSCFPGFLYVNRATKFQGCYRGFVYEESCGSNSDSTLAYKVTTIQHLKLGGYPFSQVSMVEQDCENSCLEDCTCWAAQYVNGVCSKFKLPLIYSTLDPTDESGKTFVKQSYKISQMAGHTIPYPEKRGNRNKSRKEIILILSLALGSVACLFTVVAICSYIFYRSRADQYQKLLENPYLGPNEEFTLRSFSYSELEKATEHFKEEIRHGSFGNLYKGIISEGNRTVAVKRLEKIGDEGEREFKAEMTAIGQARHRNLVHLLGFCLEGSEKILVYEYMSNGSLADILFNSEARPSWEQRMRLALDISRGILYLHEKCETCIIHCNIKPHNILVDDSWTAKISDFGLAKFLVPNQVGNQLQFKGTRGYSAPELQNSALISNKVDVYSYGVMLLEIICCRSNMDANMSTEDEIFLPTWVYKCFVENNLKKLVEDVEVDMNSLERTVKVGLLCIHDNPDLRPSMRNVVLMLEGTMDIPFLAWY